MRDQLIVEAHPSLHVPKDNSPVPAVVRGGGDSTNIWQYVTSKGKSIIPIEPVLSLSSLFMVRDAVRAGVGIARLPLSLVSHDLDVGTLISWGRVEGPDTALWALYPSRRLLSSRVIAFLIYLKEAFPMGTRAELAAHINQ